MFHKMPKVMLALLGATLLIMPLGGASKKTKQVIVTDELLNAIWMVESSGTIDPPDGDNGDSIGPYQISHAYFSDSVEFDKTIKFKYEELRANKEKSEKVIRAYMRRWAPDKATAEQIARIHNGGCNALSDDRIRLTDGYWKKVKKHL